MKRIHASLAVAGLVGGMWFVAAAVPGHAAGLPAVSICVPPSGGPGAPSQVPPSGGILVLGQQGTGGTNPSCSYKFTSSMQPEYVAATPNAWTITATNTYPPTNATCAGKDVLSADGKTCTHTDASASGAAVTDLQGGKPTPADVQGSLSGVKPGDTVTITATLACVPGDPTGGQACGAIGSIAVGSPA